MLRNAHTRIRVRHAALLLTVVGASLAGCGYDPENVSFGYVKSHLSPEMDGLSETPQDIQRNLAVNEDQTLRMFWSDLGKMWLVDQPSMLSPYFVISTNGQPR